MSNKQGDKKHEIIWFIYVTFSRNRNRRPLAERVEDLPLKKLKNKSEPSMATWAALLYSVAVFKTPVRVRTGVILIFN